MALAGAIEDCPAYVARLIGACKAKDVGVAAIIDNAAIALLAERLQTPLQVEQHLTVAFEHGFRYGENRSAQTSSRPTSRDNSMTSNRASPGTVIAEVRLFLSGALDAERTRELSEQMRVAGLPL